MTENEFEKVIEETLKQIEETLIIKGREYRRNNDPFHNFNEGVKRTGQIREKVIDGMLLKHEVSIADMTNDLEKGIVPKKATVDEKFGDNLIYLLIKKASIIDKINNEPEKLPF